MAVIGDARRVVTPRPALVATDPPYFDAIGYADLSDYFYVWHRRALKRVHPDLYTTMAAPKQGELTAIAAHHGNDRQMARNYFIDGFTDTFRNLQASLAPGLPMIVVYASREQKGGNDEQTRWSSILTSIVNADMEITGTWPILGTTDRRMVGQGSNVVATYIAMTCRPRLSEAQTTSLADFNRALRRELAVSIRDLQAASILPSGHLRRLQWDLECRSIRGYRSVLDQSGHPGAPWSMLCVSSTLLWGKSSTNKRGELDPDSRFAVRVVGDLRVDSGSIWGSR